MHLCVVFCAASLLMTYSAGADQPQTSARKAIPVPLELVQGKGLTKVPPYREAVTVKDFQEAAAKQVFAGDIVVDVYEVRDGGTLRLTAYPFDQYVHVLRGDTTLAASDGTSQHFVRGDSFIVPRGFTGTWTVSKHFRELLVIESKSLAAGIGQFER